MFATTTNGFLRYYIMTISAINLTLSGNNEHLKHPGISEDSSLRLFHEINSTGEILNECNMSWGFRIEVPLRRVLTPCETADAECALWSVMRVDCLLTNYLQMFCSHRNCSTLDRSSSSAWVLLDEMTPTSFSPVSFLETTLFLLLASAIFAVCLANKQRITMFIFGT